MYDKKKYVCCSPLAPWPVLTNHGAEYIGMKVMFQSVCASVAPCCRFPCALYAQSYCLTGVAGCGHYNRRAPLTACLAVAQSTIILFLPIYQYFKVLFALRLGAWGGVAPVVWLTVLPLSAAPQAATIR